METRKWPRATYLWYKMDNQDDTWGAEVAILAIAVLMVIATMLNC